MNSGDSSDGVKAMRSSFRSVFATLLPLSAIFLLLSSTALSADPPPREWLVLVYAVTDDFLSSCVMADLDEMETVGSDAGREILVQFDAGDHRARRHRIEKDDRPGTVTSPVLQWLGEVDPGVAPTLVDFVEWGWKRAPARRVFLVLHGALGNLGYGAPTRKRVRLEKELEEGKLAVELRKERENGARYMGIREMGKALAAIRARIGRPIDVVGCDDSCDMTVEKFVEFRADVAHWIGSVGFLPSDDWPYDRVLAILAEDPFLPTERVCAGVVEAFREAYLPYCELPYGFGATLSAVAMADLDPFVASMTELGERLDRACRKKEHRLAILRLRGKVLSYLSSDNLDLRQFLKGLAALDLGDPELPPLCRRLLDEQERCLLAHWAGGRIYGPACGVSVTVDDWLYGYDREKYRRLKWGRTSRWTSFLIRLAREFAR